MMGWHWGSYVLGVGPLGLGAPLTLHITPQWPEVHDGSAEGVWTAHPELLHPCHPACSVSGVGDGGHTLNHPLHLPLCSQAGRPCWLPAFHHPGHCLSGHCQWHLPAGELLWGSRGW